ncbi:MAG: hypothetical protein WCW33_03295 [Candidatus Babeliales bacterium]|jgi:hypothetical protein
MISRSIPVAIAICLFQITASNAMQAGSLRGDFLDIMGRKIINAQVISKEKAAYLQIFRAGQTIELAKGIVQILSTFDTNGYFTPQEQTEALEKISELNKSLDFWLDSRREGPDSINVYPLHANLVAHMQEKLTDFCTKISCSRTKDEHDDDIFEFFSEEKAPNVVAPK